MKICSKCGEPIVECICSNWVDVADHLPMGGESCEVRLSAICEAFYLPGSDVSRWVTNLSQDVDAKVFSWRYVKDVEESNEMDY